jgi:putative transposase
VLAQVPKGSAEMVAATTHTIFAQSGPAQVREQLGVIAGMHDPPVPGSRRCRTTRPTTSPPSPRSPSGTGRRSGPLTPRVAEQGDQAPTDVAGVFPDPEALLRLAGAVLVEAHDEWQVGERRYLSKGSMALLAPHAKTPREVAAPALLTA